MYRQTKFEFKNHLKFDIHRQIYADAEGCRVVTLEGEEVCLAIWRHIMEVPKITSYNYARYIIEERLAQKHGILVYLNHEHTHYKLRQP
jgi:hypothetical protein